MGKTAVQGPLRALARFWVNKMIITIIFVTILIDAGNS